MMEKREFIELANTNPDKAYEVGRNMPVDEFMQLRESFAQTDGADRNEDFKFADQILDDMWAESINTLRSHMDSLSEGELETLESLLGNLNASSQIQDIRGIRDSIAKRREIIAGEAAPVQESLHDDVAGESTESLSEPEEEKAETEVQEMTPEPTQEDKIMSLEEKYGIDEEHLQTPEIVQRNMNLFIDGGYAVYKKNADLLKTDRFSEIKTLLDAIQLTEEKGKLVSEDDAQDDIALLMEQVRNETEMYLCSTSKDPVTAEQFEEEYAVRLQQAVIELIVTDLAQKAKEEGIDKLPPDEMRKRQEEIKKEALQIYQNLSEGKKCSIGRGALIGWQATQQASIESAVKKLRKKKGFKAIAKSFKQSIEVTDKKLENRYGKVYTTLKGFAKTFLVQGAWSSAYSAALGMGPLAPYALATVATARFAVSAVQLIKDYKKQRQEAKKERQDLKFYQYMFRPETIAKIGGMAITAVGGVIGFHGSGHEVMIKNLFGHSYTNDQGRTVAGLGLAGLSGFASVRKAVRATKGGFLKKSLVAAEVTGIVAVSMGLGFIAGRHFGGRTTNLVNKMNAFIDNHFIHTDNVMPDVSNIADNTQQSVDINNNSQANIDNTVDNNQQTDISDNSSASLETTLHDRVTNLNDGQQHDIKMLFARDAREANEILGGKWMGSDALQKAWDDGTITDTQKAQLLDFASQRFDAKGNFVDMEGYTPASQMEAEAQEWTTQHTQAANEPAQTQEPLPNSENMGNDNTGNNMNAPTGQAAGMNSEAFINNYHGNVENAEVIFMGNGMSVFIGDQEFSLELADKNLVGFEPREDGTIMLTREVDGHIQKIVTDGTQLVYDPDGTLTQDQVTKLNELYAQHPENPTNPMESVRSIEDQIKGYAGELAQKTATEQANTTLSEGGYTQNTPNQETDAKQADATLKEDGHTQGSSDRETTAAAQHAGDPKTVKWNGMDVTEEQAQQLREEEQRYTEFRKSQKLWEESPQDREAAHQQHLQNLKAIIEGPQQEGQNTQSATDAERGMIYDDKGHLVKGSHEEIAKILAPDKGDSAGNATAESKSDSEVARQVNKLRGVSGGNKSAAPVTQTRVNANMMANGASKGIS